MSRSGWFALIAVVLVAITKGAQMALAVKPGVILSTSLQVQFIRQAVTRVWQQYGFTPTITSSMDGEHMQNSKHYAGLAEDYRTHDLPDDLKYAMFNQVRNILGTDYDVLFEYENQPNEHLHIEFDPK